MLRGGGSLTCATRATEKTTDFEGAGRDERCLREKQFSRALIAEILFLAAPHGPSGVTGLRPILRYARPIGIGVAEAHVAADNRPSRRAAEKAGLLQAGTFTAEDGIAMFRYQIHLPSARDSGHHDSLSPVARRVAALARSAGVVSIRLLADSPG